MKDLNITPLGVYKSAAGYYIGRYCDEGPYSKDSPYYRTREIAEQHLKNKTF